MKNTMKIFENGELIEVVQRPVLSHRERVSRNRIGSNQYQVKQKENWKKTLFVGVVLMLIISGIFRAIKVYATPAIISPIPETVQAQNIKEAKPTAKPSPAIIKAALAVEPQSSLYQHVDTEIKKVFGKHYDKAMLLLKGDGKGGCHENGGLDPHIEHKNRDANGNVKSIDYGVFQINGYWQGFRHTGKAEQFLLDPEINIRVAWSIFEADGYSFKQWTCGKAYGI